MKKKYFVGCLVIFLGLGMFVSRILSADAPRITKDELKALLGNPDLILLDIRSGSDWKDSDSKIQGMEHVGPRNYRRFFELVSARLAPGGLALVHTIGGNVSRTTTDRWIDTYIFPGGVIPSARQIAAPKEGLCS